MAPRPEVDEIVLGDSPDAWREVGFLVRDGVAVVGGVRLRLRGDSPGVIHGWSLRNLRADAELDGLPTTASRSPGDRAEPGEVAEPGEAGEPRGPGETGSAVEHPIGATAVDHVVAVTPDFDRTVAALRAAGLDFRRTREAGGGMRQAFFVVGPCLLELGGPVPDGDVRFWGLTLVVPDLDAAAALLGDRLGRVKDAVQPGRRIATVRASGGLGVPLALMTPRT